MSDKPIKEVSEEKSEDLSPEEVEAHREKTIKFYKDQNEVLEEALKYETLLADIEEQRTKSFFFKVQRTASPQPSSNKEEDKPDEFNESQAEAEEGKPRKLATN